MKTYEQAAAFLAAGRSKTYRPLPGRSTSIIRVDDTTIAIRYHDTNVVTYFASGDVRLESGGWRTLTTKDRMCEYSPASIWQERGLWYVAPGHRYAPTRDSMHVLYVDGLVVTASGYPINPPDDKERAEIESCKRIIDRMVSRYIRGYADDLVELGEIPDPTQGDCWYCLMVTTKGDTLGDAFGNMDHLWSHMQEPYYVPALLLNAAKERNYGGGPGILKMLDEHGLERGERPRASIDALRAYFRARKLALVEHLKSTRERNRTPAVGPGSHE